MAVMTGRRSNSGGPNTARGPPCKRGVLTTMTTDRSGQTMTYWPVSNPALHYRETGAELDGYVTISRQLNTDRFLQPNDDIYAVAVSTTALTSIACVAYR